MTSTGRTRAAIRIAILPAIVALAALVAWQLGYFELGRREQLIAAIDRAETTRWAAPVYVLAYVLVVALGLPATAFSIVGGAIFGAAEGLLLVWTGAMMGTVVAHTMARSIGKGAVQRLLGNHRLLRKLRERADVRTLIRLRVLPLAPFGVLDYVAGLAGVSLRTLLLATAIGILPETAAYTYAGHQARIALADTGVGGQRALFIAGLVTIAMTTIVLVSWFSSKRRSTMNGGE
ncbi:MAG: VTT domain-containing protein [Gemmatimonadaceae bacterium]